MLKLGLGTAALGRPQYINIKQDKSETFSLNVSLDEDELLELRGYKIEAKEYWEERKKLNWV